MAAVAFRLSAAVELGAFGFVSASWEFATQLRRVRGELVRRHSPVQMTLRSCLVTVEVEGQEMSYRRPTLEF